MRIELILALLLGFVIGCSSEPPAVPVTPTPSPVKAMLEELANTGEMGSGMMDIESGLNALKQTDAAKADKLLKEFGELQAANGPEQIKAKAKAMADQL